MSLLTSDRKMEGTFSGAFYVDGSCRPSNPGYIGWGLHGYFYQSKAERPVEVERFFTTSHGYVRDIEEFQKTEPSVTMVTPTHYVDGFGSFSEIASNNVAEIQGLFHLLQHLDTAIQRGITLDVTRIYTDSEYLRNSMVDWCARWKKNGWKRQDGTPVTNQALLERTHDLYLRLQGLGRLELHWIRSHNQHFGNERADMLAGIGMNHSRSSKLLTSITVSEARGFWKHKIERHPFMYHRRLYFNSVLENHRPGVYYLADSGEDEGNEAKPSSETGLSVVFLQTPETIVENTMQHQFHCSAGVNAIILMRLDELYGKHIYPWIMQYGTETMVSSKNTHSLSLVNRVPVTEEMNPVRLSIRMLEHMATLEEVLYHFHRDPQNAVLAGVPIRSLDITDQFYEKTEGPKNTCKYVLLPRFEVGFRRMDVMVPYGDGKVLKVPYNLGYDCVSRNQLKHLEPLKPTLHLLYWKDGTMLRHATVIRCGGDYGIWSNIFANQILPPKDWT